MPLTAVRHEACSNGLSVQTAEIRNKIHRRALAAKNSMKKATTVVATPRLVLCAATAADLMTPNPVWIRPDATVKEAAAFLADNHVGAVPVIDKEGRPVGVLSKSDILLHSREMVEFLCASSSEAGCAEISECSGTASPARFRVVDVDRTRVRDVMTAAVYSVAAETPVATVIEEMLARQVHRLFVVSDNGVLVGTVSAFDVMRHLHREA
jgi:CBS domain-containing protein